MKKIILASLFICFSNCLFAQLLEGNSVVWHPYAQDARIKFTFYTKGVMVGSVESGELLLNNVSSDKLLVKVRYTISDYCGNVKEFNKSEVLEPNSETKSSGAFFTGIDYETSCKEKRKYTDRISSIINNVNVYIESIENLTQKENEEKRKKEEEEKATLLKKTSYAENFSDAEAASDRGDYRAALKYYEAALATGVDNFKVKSSITSTNNKIQKVKQEQEAEIQRLESEEKKRREDLEKKNIEDAKAATLKLEESTEDLKELNEKKIEQAAQDLKRKERKKIEKLIEERQAIEKLESERLIQEKKEYKEKEKSSRRDYDDQLIESLKKTMLYDPIKYKEFINLGDKYYAEGMAINPYAALQLDSKWWDLNPYMKSFREDLNEPRRKEAWDKCQSLLYDIQADFDMAKDHYITAIEYTDYNSYQHRNLISKIESMNDMIDFQKEMIENSQQIEKEREKNFYQAKEAMKAATKSGRQAKAYLLYSATTQGATYDEWNADPKLNEAVRKRKDYERRSAQAEKQLLQDELITGVSTEVVTSTMLNDKTSAALTNKDVAFNLYTTTGLRSYPVVANDLKQTGYISETSVDGLLVMPIEAGAILWLHRGNTWNLGIAADASFGVLPFKGYQNSAFTFGGNLKLDFGIRRVKLAFEIDQHKRSGNYNYDQDVAFEDYTNPYQQATNKIVDGEFNYKVLKIGAGLHIDISDETEDGYIRLLMFADKPSFVTDYNYKKPILSFSAQIVAPGGITLGFNYAQNYPAAGKAENVIKKYDDKAFFEARVGKTWTLGKAKW